MEHDCTVDGTMDSSDRILGKLVLDRHSHQPLYLQLADGLRRCCRKFAPGTRIPTELEICRRLCCSRNIVRQALQLLTDEKLLERRRPSGTFIAASVRKTRIILVYSGLKNACNYLLEVVGGVERAAAELQVDLLKINLEFLRSSNIGEQRRIIKDMKPDGILVIASFYWGNEAELEILKDIGVPVLMPYGYYSDSEVTSFRVMDNDMRLPVCSAIRLLRSWGHTRIGAVSYETEGIHGMTAKEFSILAWCDEAHTHMVRHTGTTGAEIDAMTEYFLNLPERPTVILCHSDFYAVRILDYLHKHHIRVPEDISIMAVFAHRGSEMLNPPLTTISMELAARGEAAVHYFVNGDFSASLPQIESKLLMRKSVRILNKDSNPK